MSATIIILPVCRVDEADAAGATIRVSLSKRDLQRLRARAEQWGVPVSEAAAGVISNALDPKRSR